MLRGPEQFLRSASTIATYYGFRPLSQVHPMRKTPSFDDALTICASSISKKQEPAMTFYATPMVAHAPLNVPAREAAEFGLHIVGSEESIGEVLMLKTLYSIMSEWGEAPRLRINALGDRDSRERFKRELGSYLRRHFDTFEETERQKITQDPLSAFHSIDEQVHSVMEDAPRSVHFLSEKSRSHFRDLLEHLEAIGLSYELDPTLIGDERFPRIVFRFDTEGERGTILDTVGGRYDEFASRLSGRNNAPAVSASIFFRRKGLDRAAFTRGRELRPKVYFIQLGLRAKLQSFGVIDALRDARIPVYQSFDTTKLSPQLDAAKGAGVSHVLIMGRREALDGTIIVRSLNNSSQTIVDLNRLPKVLKTLKV